MIRLILIAIFLLIYIIISIPMFAIEYLIGKINKRAKDISSLRFVQGAFKCILFLAGVRTTVIGRENIPKDEPVLYVGNHRSYFDIVIAYSMLPDITGFVAKKEIGKVPLLRVWMRYLYCLFLDRENIKEGLKTILQGIDYIKNDGISIFIFPEGTRNKEEGILPFKEGSLKFAEKSGCKVIPVAQNNTRDIFEAHFPFIKSTKTVIEFGEPIDIKELTKEEKKFLGAYTRDKILAMYEKNKEVK